MATITGTIANPGSLPSQGIEVAFIPTDTPKAVGSLIIKTTPISVVTNSSGQLPAGLTLTAGTYTVKLTSNGTSYGCFNILVPSGSGTHDLPDIVVVTVTSSVQEVFYLAGIENPNGVVTATAGRGIFYNNLGGLWVHATTTVSNTDWVQLLGGP